jgi:hypothetical protein
MSSSWQSDDAALATERRQRSRCAAGRPAIKPAVEVGDLAHTTPTLREFAAAGLGVTFESRELTERGLCVRVTS